MTYFWPEIFQKLNLGPGPCFCPTFYGDLKSFWPKTYVASKSCGGPPAPPCPPQRTMPGDAAQQQVTFQDAMNFIREIEQEWWA